ncbi:haloacid dehalogenase type II [Bradyrhizobium sp. Tv2a-2]|uniref:haloacid dehalogenase type II n=1 Tax=Bradyrhizobium sp. Tv2a-2 TaxID=113395 RepID=UPI0003F61D04|nr:haloacid dehalogenase type II [Bradyrhizobium sp. Tv2a-2]
MSKVRNIVFDCNETLLDLTTVAPVFQRLFGEPGTVRLWFRQLITYSQALTIADVYVPFTDIGGAVLDMIATPRGVKITAADRQELTDRFATMPPYPDVPVGLRRLKAAGFHLFTLTDNTAAISGRQLTHGGIVDLFDRRFSVDDTAKRHKPAPKAYAEVARGLGASTSEMCMIACHTWDTIGVQAAGWEAGLIKRVNNDVLDTAAQPQYIGKDLNEVADQIIARHGSEHG